MLTLFMSISGGLSWEIAFQPLREAHSDPSKLSMPSLKCLLARTCTVHGAIWETITEWVDVIGTEVKKHRNEPSQSAVLHRQVSPFAWMSVLVRMLRRLDYI